MFFYRHTVAEAEMEEDACRLHRMAIEKKATLLLTKGKIGIYKYFNKKKDQLEYFMIDHSIELKTPEDFQVFNPSVMGLCVLAKLEGWSAIEVSILYVSPAFRRQGVATKLYDAILDDGQIVICGWSHNPKSRALWKKLAQDKKYVVWAQDMNDTDRISDVWFDDDGKMQCDLKIYVDLKMKKDKMKEDVRLIAINPLKV